MKYDYNTLIREQLELECAHRVLRIALGQAIASIQETPPSQRSAAFLVQDIKQALNGIGAGIDAGIMKRAYALADSLYGEIVLQREYPLRRLLGKSN